MADSILDGAFLDTLDTLNLVFHQDIDGHYSGARRSRAYGSSAEFADYRDYVPGDDLRRLDWNLAGRFDKYYIKRFIDEQQGHNVVYLDASASMGLPAEKGRMALRLAAALAYLSVANLDRVSLRALRGGTCADLCGAISGRERFYLEAERLSALDFEGDTALGEAILSDARMGKADGYSFIISDFLTSGDWRSAVDALLGRGREVALVQVLSPEELSPTCLGLRAFHGAEAGDGARLAVEVDRSALRAYHRALEEFLADIRQFCVSRGVAFLSIRSDERLEDALLTQGYAQELIR